MTKRLAIRIKGRVQGVWFRRNAQAKAEALGLVGFAQNLPDGSVYLEAEGGEDKLESFLRWCRKGPPSAQVTSCTREELASLNRETGFEVR